MAGEMTHHLRSGTVYTCICVLYGYAGTSVYIAALCMYTWIFIFLCGSCVLCVHMCMYMCTRACVYACVHVYVYVCVYACVCLGVYACGGIWGDGSVLVTNLEKKS